MMRPSMATILLAVGATITMGVVAVPAVSAGPTTKVFSSTLSSDGGAAGTVVTVAPGSTHTFGFTLANSAKSNMAFGSAQITVPTGFVVTGLGVVGPANFSVALDITGGLITLTSTGPTGTGITPGSSLTIMASVTAPASSACADTWVTRVKQSNDFSGTGNDFTGNSVATNVGSNHLSFATQPSLTEFDKPMTPAPVVRAVDPCGSTIATFTGTVTVSDAAGQLATGSTATAAAGVATFSNLTFGTFDFTDALTASTTGFMPATSDSFAVQQLVKTCDAGKTCVSGPLSDPGGTTQADITADAAATRDVLVVSVKGAPAGQFPACDQTKEPAYGSVVSFRVANRGSTVTMTLPKAYVNALPTPNGTPFWDICLSIPPAEQLPGLAFTDKFGNAGVFQGLLPDCGSPVVAPCVQSRNKNAGNEIVRFVVVPGDPHGSWY